MKNWLFGLPVSIVLLTIGAVCGEPAGMSQTPGRSTPQDFLDRNYPFVEPGQEPPGRYVPTEKLNGQVTWQGSPGWRTRHGEAIVRWSLGRPDYVQNALYPDGTRGEANDTLDHGFRRHGTDDKLWVYGRIDIRSDDVIFFDGEQPVYQPPPQGEVPNLEADLARDPAFLAHIKDDRFTLAVLNLFDNRSFYKGSDPRAWDCGLAQSAGLVADLRSRGESYQDYYPSHAPLKGIYPDDRPAIERRLRSRIDQISEALKEGPRLGIGLEDLMALLGPGHHTAEEVNRAMETLRPEAEKRRAAESELFREQQLVLLEQARRNLSVFQQSHDNEDVYEALRADLARLGWRVQTEQDRERIHREWVVRAVAVLQRVKELEQRPEAAAGAWVASVRRPQAFGPAFEPGQLEKMPPDVRMVETGGLEKRLYQLAISGRIIEPEYRTLAEQSSRR